MYLIRGINNIEKYIGPALKGKNPLNIKQIDQTMIDLDGTGNKSKLGANAILAISLANVRAGSKSQTQQLFSYIYEYISIFHFWKYFCRRNI